MLSCASSVLPFSPTPRLDRLLRDMFGKGNVIRDGSRMIRVNLDGSTGTIVLPSLVRRGGVHSQQVL
jgi:hypothetical protein